MFRLLDSYVEKDGDPQRFGHHTSAAADHEIVFISVTVCHWKCPAPIWFPRRPSHRDPLGNLSNCCVGKARQKREKRYIVPEFLSAMWIPLTVNSDRIITSKWLGTTVQTWIGGALFWSPCRTETTSSADSLKTSYSSVSFVPKPSCWHRVQKRKLVFCCISRWKGVFVWFAGCSCLMSFFFLPQSRHQIAMRPGSEALRVRIFDV